jgi:hypothetical protein
VTSERQAKWLDKHIRLTMRMPVREVDDWISELADAIDVAKATQIHEVLGFQNWQSYIVDVAAEELPPMHVETRSSVIKFLAREGISQRGIGQAVVSAATVNNVIHGETGF